MNRVSPSPSRLLSSFFRYFITIRLSAITSPIFRLSPKHVVESYPTDVSNHIAGCGSFARAPPYIARPYQTLDP